MALSEIQQAIQAGGQNRVGATSALAQSAGTGAQTMQGQQALQQQALDSRAQFEATMDANRKRHAQATMQVMSDLTTEGLHEVYQSKRQTDWTNFQKDILAWKKEQARLEREDMRTMAEAFGDLSKGMKKDGGRKMSEKELEELMQAFKTPAGGLW